jgi:hypothetical protein
MKQMHNKLSATGRGFGPAGLDCPRVTCCPGHQSYGHRMWTQYCRSKDYLEEGLCPVDRIWGLD